MLRTPQKLPTRKRKRTENNSFKKHKDRLQHFVTAGLSIKHLSVQIRISKKSPRNPVNNENAPQKAGEEFGPLCLFNIQKKGTGENPDTFFGAEGETRRAFNPSCSLCEQFILCPFLLRKKMDGEFESLQTNSYIQKEKAQRKNPCAFSGAEGETRTLAPVTRPTPLAGAPRHQLEYFCIGSVYDTIRLLKERAENPLPLLSGGESGIRTHGTLPYDGFQDRSVITTSVSLRIRRKL